MAITDVTSKVNNLYVATAVKFAEDTLKRVSGMTFLYDPNWSVEQNQFNGTSLPFAFFETLSHELVQVNEVSESRILLYDPKAATPQKSDGQFVQSVLQVVADNVTTKPLIHRIECLVPFGFITKLFSEALNTLELTVTAFNNSKLSSSSLEYVRQMMSVLQLANATVAGTADIVSAFTAYNNAMYNRNSILAMERCRNIVQIKTWEGWELRYGIIKSFSCKKVGTEDDYLRGVIEIQEMPLLFMGDTTKLSKDTKISGATVKTVQTKFQSFYKAVKVGK